MLFLKRAFIGILIVLTLAALVAAALYTWPVMFPFIAGIMAHMGFHSAIAQIATTIVIDTLIAIPTSIATAIVMAVPAGILALSAWVGKWFISTVIEAFRGDSGPKDDDYRYEKPFKATPITSEMAEQVKNHPQLDTESQITDKKDKPNIDTENHFDAEPTSMQPK